MNQDEEKNHSPLDKQNWFDANLSRCCMLYDCYYYSIHYFSMWLNFIQLLSLHFAFDSASSSLRQCSFLFTFFLDISMSFSMWIQFIFFFNSNELVRTENRFVIKQWWLCRSVDSVEYVYSLHHDKHYVIYIGMWRKCIQSSRAKAGK